MHLMTPFVKIGSVINTYSHIITLLIGFGYGIVKPLKQLQYVFELLDISTTFSNDLEELFNQIVNLRKSFKLVLE